VGEVWIEAVDRFIAATLGVGHDLAEVVGDLGDVPVGEDAGGKAARAAPDSYDRREGTVTRRERDARCERQGFTVLGDVDRERALRIAGRELSGTRRLAADFVVFDLRLDLGPATLPVAKIG
jgi:hypothetical protein